MPTLFAKYGTDSLGISTPKNSRYFAEESKRWLLLALLGLALGLSAPGIGCSGLAWVGLVPLLWFSFTSKDVPEAFVRGLIFGTAYNLLSLFWCLDFSPLVWPAAIKPHTLIANTLVWIFFSAQQGTLFGSFAALLKILPLRLSFLPAKSKEGFLLPALLVLPLLWVLIFNKLGNNTGSISVPWSMLEYTQHKQLELLQLSSLVGGPGIGAIIVLLNLLVFGILAVAARQKVSFHQLTLPSAKELGICAFASTALLSCGIIYGAERLKLSDQKQTNRELPFSILQGNCLLSLNETDPKVHLDTYLSMARKTPPGVCVWPEWSMVLPVSKYPEVYAKLGEIASQSGQGWIIGAVDCDKDGKTYNAVCTVGAGAIKPDIYHKQFLVPFGEYTPSWIMNSPFSPLCGTLTPRAEGYSAAVSSGSIGCGSFRIAPLLCCELMKPELSNKGVRAGGEVLTDCSNTLWFRSALLGKQSIAISQFRAAETHRAFIFASSIGPSAIIDAYGRVLQQSPRDQSTTLSAVIPLYTDITPFVWWYR